METGTIQMIMKTGQKEAEGDPEDQKTEKQETYIFKNKLLFLLKVNKSRVSTILTKL